MSGDNEAAERLRANAVYMREPADETYLSDLDAALAAERRAVAEIALEAIWAQGFSHLGEKKYRSAQAEKFLALRDQLEAMVPDEEAAK